MLVICPWSESGKSEFPYSIHHLERNWCFSYCCCGGVHGNKQSRLEGHRISLLLKRGKCNVCCLYCSGVNVLSIIDEAITVARSIFDRFPWSHAKRKPNARIDSLHLINAVIFVFNITLYLYLNKFAITCCFSRIINRTWRFFHAIKFITLSL